MSSGGCSSSQQAWGRGSSSQSDWKPAWKKHDDWKDYLGDDTHGWKKPEAITGKLLAYADTSGEVHGGGSTAEAVPEHKDLHDLKSSWQADEKDFWVDKEGNLYRKKWKNSPVNSNLSLNEVQKYSQLVLESG